ncbi:phospholipid metabolism enzyme regulator [Alternaria burnsii]|uniref:Phospholipid metabolism enzyme regulator n=1 Tax=Alternaria burnsii TaxID=1187904 RepID=A0A8H7B1T6_9PLEO|nr:phospholipid metabolism enzyme regulator [Alternaria burnsii]KAF7673040.1 phospholipid metabolism enzyme regulator [Alternaria burnsii]
MASSRSTAADELNAFESFTGVEESAEPTTSTTRDDSTVDMARDTSAPPMGQNSAGQRLFHAANSPSPLSSREASPRPHKRNATPSGAGTTARPSFRTRKSSADASPSRGSSLSNSTTAAAAAASGHATPTVQRALSSTSIPELTPTSSTDTVRAPRPSKPSSKSNSGETTPHWPLSPRLKSPPPGDDGRSRSRTNSLRAQIRKPEAQSAPSIVVQSSSPASLSRFPVREEAPASDPDEPQPQPAPKATSRSSGGVAPKLATVQESSLPATPGFDGLEPQSQFPFPSANFVNLVLSFVPSATAHKTDQDRNDVNSSKVTEDLSTKHDNTKHTESGSDSATKSAKKGKMQEQRNTYTHRPHTVSAKPSLSSMSTRSRDPPLRNMTVETETVPSVAQPSIVNQDRSASGRVDGGVRLKASNETIRPKKERKAPKRKAPSINAGTGRLQHISYHYYTPSRPDPRSRSSMNPSFGSPVSYRSYDDRRSLLTMSPPSSELRMAPLRPPLKYFYSSTNTSTRTASSKADVFEQKVASAVDEADSSDSDATFIYESNPPEQPHRSRQHHSRTPSMTSLASLTDPRLQIRDTHKHPSKKSSIKFTNPYNNPSIDGDDRGEGTIRIGSGRAGGGSHHHHIGRHGQGRGALSHLAMESDTSVPQSSRARGPSSRNASQPNSPRFHTFNVGNGHSNGSKKSGEYSAAYDIDAENIADDERTPLIQSGRSPRSTRTSRQRNTTTIRQLERRHHRDGGWCRRFAGCLVLTILLLVVVFCAIGLVFATTKPLTSLVVRDIQNVVASQEEVMLDLIVNAVNPNIIGVTVSDMEVSLFAKSKHVGSDAWWREHGNGPHDDVEHWTPIEEEATTEISIAGVDEGTDPIEGEPRTMLLGRIAHFDSPLNFEGSFFQRKRAESIGEIRLLHPGNKTEAGGSERWEEVLQYPFELIVRGNFKYTLPLSTQEFKVPVTASHYYDPDIERKKELDNVESKEKRRNISYVSTKPRGRYDRRALSFWSP